MLLTFHGISALEQCPDKIRSCQDNSGRNIQDKSGTLNRNPNLATHQWCAACPYYV